MQFVKERLGDIVAGLVTSGVGLFIVTEASSYRLGTLLRMGPGYFPRLLGVVMVLLGLLMIVTARPGGLGISVSRGQWRSTALLGAAFAAFVLTIEPLGMLAAVSVTVFLAAMANDRTPLTTALVLAVLTAIGCTLLFSVALGLQIKAF
ncbi:tripartite tricarboxylate transporter TctB family protein [Mesorhizobium xinjiangense]|uniref:tripartite tricarboxylate transporter TctB family protein n=1 Tax=Mesorhizobium xinjiangense TaxID=2678685 RepID=UPI0012EE2C77|nr:tripartite tricarboxylate transporter TctB family protein [Mesorhizobium xinjiangense]